MRAALLSAVLFLPFPAQAAPEAVCYYSAFVAELAELVDQAEAEYPKWDAGRFVELSEEIEDTIPCLEDKMTTDIAARVHRVMGLRARIVDGDTDRARLAFAASRALAPKYTFPEDIVAPGDPELIDYSAVPVALEITERSPRPKEGNLRFDGRQTLERPITFATIFQHIDDNGMVLETVYLWPGEPLPSYFTTDTGVQTSEADPNRFKKYLVGGLSAGMAGAGITLIGNGAWDKDHTCIGEAEDSACVLQARDRVIGGAILTAVGVGGFVGLGFMVDGQARGVSVSGTW